MMTNYGLISLQYGEGRFFYDCDGERGTGSPSEMIEESGGEKDMDNIGSHIREKADLIWAIADKLIEYKT